MPTVVFSDKNEARYRGLRMSAEEYLQIEDDGFLYELIDGVVCMSPSPTPRHQRILTRLSAEISRYLEDHPIGEVIVEVDVHLGVGPSGRDLVYRPDIVFLGSDMASRCQDRITGPPDLVVEIISDHSRHYDSVTKKSDYERCGVEEYWLIDPGHGELAFYHLNCGHFEPMPITSAGLTSQAIPGFVLNTDRVRTFFKPS